MGYSLIIYTYTKGPSIPLATFVCSLFWLWPFICSRNMFNMSLDIMHPTYVVISFQKPMLSTLPCSPPPSAWIWIASLDIINTFHLGLSHPHSYHHLPYVFYIKVQCVLRIPLIWLVVNPSYIVAWHAFLLFHSWCLSFSPWGGEKATKKHTTICVDPWQGSRIHYKTFKHGNKSYSTSINTIASRMGICSYRGSIFEQCMH